MKDTGSRGIEGPMYSRLPLTIAMCMLSLACSSSGSGTTGNGASSGSIDGGSSGTVVPTGNAAVVKQAIVASAASFDIVEETKVLAAKAVFEASIQTGGTEVVARGTLTQQGQTETFVYSPEPTDRLVVVFTDGTRDELWVTDMRGDFSGSADDYLGRDHVFRYRIVQTGGKVAFDVEIADGVVSGQTEATLKGTFEIEGVSYAADVRRAGTKKAEVDIQFAEHTTEEALTGTITGGQLAVQLSETYRYRSVASSGRFLQSITRTVDDTWTEGGSSFAAEGMVQKHLENFQAIEIDTGTGWKAEGTITKDGAPIGTLGLERGPGVVSIVATVDGQKIVLESTTIKQ